MKSVFDRGHRAGVVIEDRHLLDLPDRANPQLAGVTEGSCRFSSALLLRWSAAALWKGRARGRKGTAPSDSALGTESDEPGLVTPVGRAGAPMFIVGGIHQADKSRHCCLVSLSTHVKSSRWRQHQLTHSLGKHTQWGHSGRDFLSFTQVLSALNNSYWDSTSCPWTAQLYIHSTQSIRFTTFPVLSLAAQPGGRRGGE